MTTHSLRRLPLLFLLVLLGLPVTAARAGDVDLVYAFPSHDPEGVAASAQAGIVGCGGGLAGACAAAGTTSLGLEPRRPIARGRQGVLQFAAPDGTVITGGSVRVRVRTRAAGVVARVLQRTGSRWSEQRRLRSATSTVRTVPVGAGGTAVGIALTAESALDARAIRAADENRIAIEEVRLRVRDLHAPSVHWTDGAAFADGAWRTGTICGHASAADRGLGVDRIELRVGPEVVTVEGQPQSRLRPRPAQLAGSLCLDSASLEDGAYGTSLVAVDGVDEGNRSERLTGLVRIDNTPPDVVVAMPDDPEDRQPVIRLQALDRSSGLERVEVTLNGEPLSVRDDGTLHRAQPAFLLPDGRHRVEWAAVDKAGNRTAGREVLLVEDRSGPVIERIGPWGISTADVSIRARVRDDGAGLQPDGVRIAVGGQDLTVLADWEDDVLTLRSARGWDPGRHEVRIVAVDRSGNRTVATWDFEVLAPPQAPEPAPTPEPGPPPAVEEPAGPSADPGPEVRAPQQGVRIDAPATVALTGGRGLVRIEVMRDGEAAVGLRLRVRWQGGRALPSAVVDDEGIAEIAVVAKTDGILEIDGAGAAVDVRVRVRSRIVWREGTRRARTGGALILRGSSLPARAGRGTLEAYSGGTWQRVRPVAFGRDGRFSVRVVLPVAGRYLVRVQAYGGRSETLRLRAG